jgi:hypothetical protein
MITRRSGGMTEFIPSPSEKRDGVIRNHVLDLLANLDARLRRIEEAANLPTDLADEFALAMNRIRQEEQHVQRLNEKLLEAGISHCEEAGG